MLMCYWRRNKVLPSNLKMSPKIYAVVNLGARIL
ncbi:uncharacterized protein G2W53_035016 [Senna tora]|uniref:Uncharacterized protein n=1 Tax=Senna tora TaxID=362788 RepID=A0A834SS45_9FABA|nr:uncharacterized protein G2W53_035016 [Senna tora]